MKKETCQVLIVDDDPDYTYLLEEAFKRCPSSPPIKVLHSGDELLAWLDTSQRPNLILLDINMPGGNGFDLLTILKGVDHFRSIPVVMLSVSGFRDDVVKSYSRGANAYITKPARFEELQERIDVLSYYWTNIVKTPGSSWLKPDGYSSYNFN